MQKGEGIKGLRSADYTEFRDQFYVGSGGRSLRLIEDRCALGALRLRRKKSLLMAEGKGQRGKCQNPKYK